ncbi:AP-1 complex subunit sigma-1 [Camellia lanceoleosa]|uniref:AP-1 complex subunit sigma-1 n=1 Tax=Camellia lanceoleosa TaxID=1840588 RepID=A0ACC0H894_9ERIC|nr:AP-1 complex subunit sigma-1 [Camellia lanceoleosa]
MAGVSIAYENEIMLSVFLHVFQIHFVLLISRQGKVRLTKWYSPYTQKERTKGITEGNCTKKYAVPKCPPILPSPLFGLPDKGGLYVQNPLFSWDYLSNPKKFLYWEVYGVGKNLGDEAVDKEGSGGGNVGGLAKEYKDGLRENLDESEEEAGEGEKDG